MLLGRSGAGVGEGAAQPDARGFGQRVPRLARAGQESVEKGVDGESETLAGIAGGELPRQGCGVREAVRREGDERTGRATHVPRGLARASRARPRVAAARGGTRRAGHGSARATGPHRHGLHPLLAPDAHRRLENLLLAERVCGQAATREDPSEVIAVAERGDRPGRGDRSTSLERCPFRRSFTCTSSVFPTFGAPTARAGARGVNAAGAVRNPYSGAYPSTRLFVQMMRRLSRNGRQSFPVRYILKRSIVGLGPCGSIAGRFDRPPLKELRLGRDLPAKERRPQT